MPNGFFGSQQEWDRIESPLRPLDGPLEDLARQHGMSVARSERNWPSRSLHWGDEIQRMVQIYLETTDDLVTWSVWACASQDRQGKRYWKRAFLKKGVPINEVTAALDALLAEGKRMADGWQSADLERVSGGSRD